MEKVKIASSWTKKEITMPTPRLICITKSTIPENITGESHIHPFAELFYINHAGPGGRFCINGHTVEVRSGDLIIINPFVNHFEACGDTDNMVYVVLAMENVQFFQKNNPVSHYEKEDPQNDYIHISSFPRADRLASYFSHIEAELALQDNYSDLAADAWMAHLLVLLVRETRYGFFHVSDSAYTSFVAAAKQYIDSYFCEEITVDVLADKAHISKYHLIREFKKQVGKSPIQYLMDVRIAYACNLILNFDFSLTSISKKSGFSNSNYFSNIFRKITGLSPKKYRSKAAAQKKDS